MQPYIDFIVFGIVPAILAVAFPGVGGQVVPILTAIRAARDAANEGFDVLISHAEAGTVPTPEERMAFTAKIKARGDILQGIDASKGEQE